MYIVYNLEKLNSYGVDVLKLSRILVDIPHEIIQSGGHDITSVTIDSREVKQGTLFICLRGLSVDGHNFIDTAVKGGAVAILVEEFSPPQEFPQDVAVIRVENTRYAMAFVAANFYEHPARQMRFIGVTGTNGKTTVTTFIEEILRKCERKTGLIGTVGARVGEEPLNMPFATSTTPDPLELHAILAKMLEMGVQDVVMEVSSHALALHKVEGITFDVGVFTNLTQDHLDFHGTMENYRLAKAKLFAQSNYAVVNNDDESTPTMLKFLGDNPYLTYGIDDGVALKNTDLLAIHINKFPSKLEGTYFELAHEEPTLHFDMPIKGRFNIYNILATIGVTQALGVPIEPVRQAISTLKGVPGRIQSVQNDKGLNVFVDYAHSPDGLSNILSAVRDFTTGRLIVIFGCGGDRDTEKRPIMGRIAGELSNFCILTSDNPRTENPFAILEQVEEGTKETGTPYEVLQDRREAIFKGVNMLKPDDALVIAGKGHEDYQIIGTEKHHFDDYEVAIEAIKAIQAIGTLEVL